MEKYEIEQTLREFIPHSASYCIPDLVKAIKDYYLEKLPKEKVIEKGNQEFKKGINFAITEIRKAIEGGG